MKKRLSEKGFTLIEVMVVLVIISILLLVFIPNLTKNQGVANSKSCEAVLELTEAQILAYKADTGSLPSSIADLTGDYIDSDTCPDGSSITIDGYRASVSSN
ncbi:competence type IV pilus major pilin ComGC [Alkalicoccus luteus]|uniref:ComG operon protein 3 n=1 Tax=Alkalicoccus luteus TaxID=1237094 RepID=A0A969TV23_9BACI|nr:competence type IV pilus major pilin ComGC [Alkalicoccus luteus]NJP37657.1 prepilin-type N-terminal cleavage/methylation domain-containing protein [Alkalicoccus luteus]